MSGFVFVFAWSDPQSLCVLYEEVQGYFQPSEMANIGRCFNLGQISIGSFLFVFALIPLRQIQLPPLGFEIREIFCCIRPSFVLRAGLDSKRKGLANFFCFACLMVKGAARQR